MNEPTLATFPIAILATFPMTDGWECRVVELGVLDADLNPTRGQFTVVKYAPGSVDPRSCPRAGVWRRADRAMAEGLTLAGWGTVRDAFDEVA